MDWRQKIHIEPPTGWLNDPNGLCFHDGRYHVYYQCCPDDPDGTGLKCWGHYVSTDLLGFEYKGTVLVPDIPEDRTGVFSGSAALYDGKIHLFYTGNVEEEGDYDYVTAGRQGNQIHVVTCDGDNMGPKNVILRPRDYPDYCSCHVRDPKVWLEDGKWNMVLGARTLDDRGGVLFFEAEDPDHWRFTRFVTCDDMGYMWECPDFFDLGGKTFLALSPQGLKHEEFRYQNVFSSGYFSYDRNSDTVADFEEFDYGFDFYAPQTFLDKNGNRVLIGWMGIGDSAYTNPTKALGWQHCLTIPRMLKTAPDGKICQLPVVQYSDEVAPGPFAIRLKDKMSSGSRILAGGALISYADGVLSLSFTDGSGYGRGIRRVKCGMPEDLNIICDTSSIEIFINRGRFVMSSRFYPDKPTSVDCHGCSVDIIGISHS